VPVALEDVKTVHRLVARHSAACPDGVALVYQDRTVTYADLEGHANQLARHLIELGVAPGDSVGVLQDRSPEFVVTILAIAKAGGNYVPLDPAYPQARLEAMTAQTRTGLVITSGASGDCCASFPDAVKTLALDDMTGALETQPRRDPGVRVDPDDILYTMFTSGSTGAPKGVSITHRGVARLVQDPGFASLDREQVMLHLSSVSFDPATLEIWGALANGAKLVIAPPRSSVVDLGRIIRQQRVTTAQFPTGLFHIMVSERLDDMKSLHQVVVGGDVLSPSVANTFLTAAPGCRLVNAYGPTEVTTITCAYEVPTDHDPARPVPIGRPIRDTEVHILDGELTTVPRGAPGQLYAGGAGIARGYVNASALTAERFIPHPSAMGQRLYATGDLARYNKDGLVEFLGRIDRQVKREGFRVELTEIEETLRADPALRDAIVVPDSDSAERPKLVAHILPVSEAIDALELVSSVRGRLRHRLPEYLMPDDWAVLDALPLTPSGKIDMHALPARQTGPQSHRGAIGDGRPRGTLDETILDIWRHILGLDSIGLNENFFELGGTSLKANQVVSRLRARLGVEVPLAVIFDHPTVTGLADLIAEVL
jgi:amino acid adenylation domain-containing protein